MSSDDIVLIERTALRSRSSSMLGSTAAAINTIVEEDSDGSVKSLDTIDGVPVVDEQPLPPKRLSFAPDPIHYRQARMQDIRTSRRGSSSDEEPCVHGSPPGESTGGFLSVMRRLTSIFSSRALQSASDSNAPQLSDFSNSDRTSSRTRRVRTTVFTRGSTTLSVASSVMDEVQNEAINTRENPCIKRRYYNALRWLIQGRVWKYTCYIFIFVMLFGSQIQVLWLPKSWDVACDVVFTMSIVFLSLDIIFQSIVGESSIVYFTSF